MSERETKSWCLLSSISFLLSLILLLKSVQKHPSLSLYYYFFDKFIVIVDGDNIIATLVIVIVHGIISNIVFINNIIIYCLYSYNIFVMIIFCKYAVVLLMI